MTHGGQIVLSHTVYDKVKGGEQQQQEGQEEKPRTLASLGKFEIPDAPLGTLTSALPRVLTHCLAS
jgi:hypothetical protein